MSSEKAFPVLPLRDIVIFPRMVVPLFVGRSKSIKALQKAMKDKRKILFVTQINADDNDPSPKQLYHVGTVANILQMLKLPDGAIKVLVEGETRIVIKDFIEQDDCLFAEGEEISEVDSIGDAENQAIISVVLDAFDKYVDANKNISRDIIKSVKNAENVTVLLDLIAQNLTLKVPNKQKVLETLDIHERMKHVIIFMENEIEVLAIEKKIRDRVRGQVEKSQKDFYLHEQLKAIQKEMGDEDGQGSEMAELLVKIRKASLPKLAQEKVDAEVKKLKSMSMVSSEATVIRNYIDWIIDLPWKKRSKMSRDLSIAEGVLEKDHYGLDKIKERILEHLAVQMRVDNAKSPIICFVGPPGVGKTSLAKSIAKAMNREFVRISLGGVRDEAEIRGHRRTYVGAMPGRILQAMKRAGTVNPVFLLDEIDKIGNDWRGDPASALLEVLDPEQNKSFNDHYLELDYDLSQVMFVATANSLNLPRPLLDRLEVVRISGYTEEEKVGIAKNYLIPKQSEENKLKEKDWFVSDDVLREMVRGYTRESGVRELSRVIATTARKTVRRLAEEKAYKKDDNKASLVGKKILPPVITVENLSQFLGVRKYHDGDTNKVDFIGVVTGLAWTEVGGEVLSIESVLVPGKGQVIKTGKLGDVMKESIQAAESYIKSRSVEFGLEDEMFSKYDLHLHVPEGATPKDGPSAGVGMITSLVSTLTKVPVRHDVAMTGEITLRGRVLAIGGLKEKLLAALRSGIETVLIPKDNEKDLQDIPELVKDSLEIIAVSHVDEVLERALVSDFKLLKKQKND